MNNFQKATSLIFIFLFISCYKGDIKIINDKNNIFEATVENQEFELSQVKRCTFPNPCSVDGGFNYIFLQNNELEFHVEDVKNNLSFRVSIHIIDTNLPVNILYGSVDYSNIDEIKNWISIKFIDEEYLWIDYKDGGSIRTRNRYRLKSGTVTLNTFDINTFDFSATFSGTFKLIKNSLYDYPEGIDEELRISNGFFKITEDPTAQE